MLGRTPENDLPEGLARFCNPSLDDIQHEATMAWGLSFTDPKLHHDILKNPRLQPRVVAMMTAPCPAPEPHTLAAHPGGPVINMLLNGRQDILVQTLGLVWHHTTILEWVTWNQLSEKMPGIRLLAAREAITLVDTDLLDAAGAPARVNEALSQKRIMADGKRLLNVWANELEIDLYERLMLFVPIGRETGTPMEQDLVRSVAEALQQDGDAA